MLEIDVKSFLPLWRTLCHFWRARQPKAILSVQVSQENCPSSWKKTTNHSPGSFPTADHWVTGSSTGTICNKEQKLPAFSTFLHSAHLPGVPLQPQTMNRHQPVLVHQHRCDRAGLRHSRFGDFVPSCSPLCLHVHGAAVSVRCKPPRLPPFKDAQPSSRRTTFFRVLGLAAGKLIQITFAMRLLRSEAAARWLSSC